MKLSSELSALVFATAVTTSCLTTVGAVNFIIIQPDDFQFYEPWSPPAYLPWPNPNNYPGEFYPGISDLPWINKLKDQGLHLTQAYASSPKCATSRYSTITGRYASRSSFGRNRAIQDGVTDPSDVTIPNTKLEDRNGVSDGMDCSEGNIAQVFQKNGYVTGMVGKWHLSRTTALGGTVQAVKDEIKRCGFMNVEAMYPDNFHDSFEDWAQTIDHNMEYLAYKAVEFIEDNANNDFFLYFNPTAPHIPDIVTALTKDCRATVDGDFTDSMTTGWSVEGMTKEFGDDCSAYREDVKARAAQSTSSDDLGSIWVDDAIGAIYKALERTNQLNDTVILFQLDHGMKEKDLIWEGGIRIPQFIHYPNGFGTTPRTWDGLVSTIDIGPTFLDIAGIDEANVHRYSMDGKSWKDAVDNINGIGDDWKGNRCLFFESNQERAVRCGCDKYITLSSTSVEKSDAVARGFTGWDSNTNVTLVNLCDSSDHYIDADPSATSPEAENVIASEPQKASDLASLLQCHLDKTNANNASPLYQECIGDIATPAPNLRGTSPPTPAPVQDITAPLVNSLTPEDGSFTALTLATLHVTVSDESSIRNVAFQLRKPDDSILAFEEGIIVETNADGSEKWEKDVTLDMSGQWQWRARIVDNSPNRNIFVTDWTELLVLGGVSPIEDVVDMIKSEIEALILDNPVLRPKFLRLGFHDCVGGCDGCVNMDNADNNGLDIPIDALAPVVAKYANNAQLTAAIGSPISRADIWALATLTGADMSTDDSVTFSMTHIGRVDCIGADDSGKGGPDPELPGPDLDTHELITYFSDNFDFDVTETVAIMGGHSIGALRRENSGFAGPFGWVANPNVLDNGYYSLLIGGNTDPSNFWDLYQAPEWVQEVIENDDIYPPSRIQWFRAKDPQNPVVGPDGELERIIMLNSDIALIRDFSSNMEATTLASGEIVPGSVSSCSFRCGGRGRLIGCPNETPPLCPHAAATFDKVAEYAFDNDSFLQDFKAALFKMLKNGYDDVSLVEVTANEASA